MQGWDLGGAQAPNLALLHRGSAKRPSQDGFEILCGPGTSYALLASKLLMYISRLRLKNDHRIYL
jgi:hypothetical protein